MLDLLKLVRSPTCVLSSEIDGDPLFLISSHSSLARSLVGQQYAAVIARQLFVAVGRYFAVELVFHRPLKTSNPQPPSLSTSDKSAPLVCLNPRTQVNNAKLQETPYKDGNTYVVMPIL